MTWRTSTSHKRTSRRRVLQSLGAGAVVTSLAGCTDLIADGDDDDEEVDDTLRVGVLAPDPETNPVGGSIVGGAEIAAQELTGDGGVLDADDVEVYVGNTGGTASGARDAYSELVLEHEVHFTLGNFVSEALLAIEDDIADEEKIHLTAGVGTPQITESVAEDYDRYKYMFRVGPFNSVYLGQSLVDFAAEYYQDELGWERTAVLYEDAEWTPPVVEVLDDQLDDHGFEVVDTVSYSLETTSFAPIFDDLQAQDIDGVTTVIAHTGETAAGQWNSQERPFGFGGILVPAQFPFQWEVMDGDIAYTWTLNTAAPGVSITDRTEPFTQAFIDATEQPPVYTGYIAYDAVHIYAAYADHVGSVDEDDIIAAMESNELDLTTTTAEEFEFWGRDHEYPHDLAYDRDDWLDGRSAPIFNQWQDGDLITFKPESHEQAPYAQPDWI